MMKRSNQKGAALILALIFMLVLSVLAVSIMFLSRTETWSSMNYRFMTQARYGAEAGLNAAVNYIVTAYNPPGGPGDPMANYDTTKSPVQSGGNDVILSSVSGVTPNYPVPSVQTAFNQASQGALTAGFGQVNYVASAKLLSMRQVNVFGSPAPMTIQTWLITADGNIANVVNSQVEVSAILERQITPTFSYAAYGVNNGCGSLAFSGGGATNSYDSSTVVGGLVATQNFGGDVGSNGNLNENGAPTTINGTLSTPRTGVGSCAAGGVSAWTNNGNAKVTGGVIQLPQQIVFPPPVVPPPGATNVNPPSGITILPPGNYGDITLNGQAQLHLQPGTYNINSLNESGANTSITIDPIPGSVPPQYAPVILNVTGNNWSTPIGLTGNSIQNPTLNPVNFQIVYAGTGTIQLAGGSQDSSLVYAPNAHIVLRGGADWYGAMIGQFVNDAGGATIHYDRNLKKNLYTVGNYMLDTFTWSKY